MVWRFFRPSTYISSYCILIQPNFKHFFLILIKFCLVVLSFKNIVKIQLLALLFCFYSCSDGTRKENQISNKKLNVLLIVACMRKIEILEISLTIKIMIINTDSCLLYTSPSPRDRYISRMPSSA